jgi:hypothetical protein
MTSAIALLEKSRTTARWDHRMADGPRRGRLATEVACRVRVDALGVLREHRQQRPGVTAISKGLHLPRPRWLVAGAIVLFVLLAVFTFYVMPPLLIHSSDFQLPSARVKAENDTRTVGVQLLAGLALGLGAVFAAITLVYNREQQITERFTRAIDQLGHRRADVRIGGIYGLERIMNDSARDHGAIVEVLTAFVREHAPVSDPPPEEYERPDGDVQAALTVLGRRPVRADRELDFLRMSDTFLRRALLRGARFRSVRLRNARLENAHLERATLVDAHLRGVYLEHADLEGADLTNASLVGAHLDNATLIKARMGGVKLDRASMQGTHLAGATGDPLLTEAQRRQAHCLPDQNSCDAH